LSLEQKTILITGAARRVGACTAEMLHAAGANIVIHYRSSTSAADLLCSRLNQKRPASAVIAQADLNDLSSHDKLIADCVNHFGQLDGLVNNASSFFATPLGDINENAWDDLLGSNLKAPLFLSQAAAAELRKNQGAIVNMVDIHADKPLKNHSVYCAAKAGLVSLTKSLARELAPQVRVNAIAPGAILWPEHSSELDDTAKQAILDKIPLQRVGEPMDIAKAVLFLLRDANYITGQILSVDGGRSIR